MDGTRRPFAQRGASMTEFVVVAPVLIFLGLGALQLGLIYHGNTILNYATFEAARTGAVNHALPAPMRRELGLRLAPLVGGDGSAGKAAEALARSLAEIDLAVTADGRPKPPTRLEILNPTRAAFDAWGVESPDAARRVIPNAHLRHRGAGAAAGERGDPPLSLAEANLLKIEVTHGLELKVPGVNRFLTTLLAATDPENAAWYAAGRLPLKSVATVRMQSEAWIDALDAPAAAPPPAAITDAAEASDPLDAAAPSTATDGDAPGGNGDGCDTVTGLPSSPVLLETSGYESGSCGIADTGYGSPQLPAPGAGGIGAADGSTPLC